MDSKMIVLRGLPASGKSTYAAQMVMNHNYKRFNRDDLRMMVDNGLYSKANEKFVTFIMYTMIEMALADGWNIVVDNTNFHPFQVRRCKEIAEKYGAELEIRDFDTPVGVCIERDLQRDHGRVGKNVIMSMYEKWFKDGKFPSQDSSNSA